MELDIAVRLDYAVSGPVDLLLQIEAAELDDQKVSNVLLDTGWAGDGWSIAAESDVGRRLWLRLENDFLCMYNARVVIDRETPDLAGLSQVSPHNLPGDAVRYLMPSRFCPSDAFQTFVNAEFGTTSGGARIMALRDWIEDRFAYVPGASGPQTTALDTFVQRQGVCRDFAHVLITMARASTIPARFVSVYAPDVNPPDFHAVAEVYLDDAWHLVDPTGMADPSTIARIGVGADAADVSFMANFGMMMLRQQWVSVTRV